MSVGLMVGYNWWTIGEGSLFNSFFSTIYVRLENMFLLNLLKEE